MKEQWSWPVSMRVPVPTLLQATVSENNALRSHNGYREWNKSEGEK